MRNKNWPPDWFGVMGDVYARTLRLASLPPDRTKKPAGTLLQSYSEYNADLDREARSSFGMFTPVLKELIGDGRDVAKLVAIGLHDATERPTRRTWRYVTPQDRPPDRRFVEKLALDRLEGLDICATQRVLELHQKPSETGVWPEAPIPGLSQLGAVFIADFGADGVEHVVPGLVYRPWARIRKEIIEVWEPLDLNTVNAPSYTNRVNRMRARIEQKLASPSQSLGETLLGPASRLDEGDSDEKNAQGLINFLIWMHDLLHYVDPNNVASTDLAPDWRLLITVPVWLPETRLSMGHSASVNILTRNGHFLHASSVSPANARRTSDAGPLDKGDLAGLVASLRAASGALATRSGGDVAKLGADSDLHRAWSHELQKILSTDKALLESLGPVLVDEQTLGVLRALKLSNQLFRSFFDTTSRASYSDPRASVERQSLCSVLQYAYEVGFEIFCRERIGNMTDYMRSANNSGNVLSQLSDLAAKLASESVRIGPDTKLIIPRDSSEGPVSIHLHWLVASAVHNSFKHCAATAHERFSQTEQNPAELLAWATAEGIQQVWIEVNLSEADVLQISIQNHFQRGRRGREGLTQTVLLQRARLLSEALSGQFDGVQDIVRASELEGSSIYSTSISLPGCGLR